MDRRATLVGLVAAAALVAFACGGGNPAGPSGGKAVVVQGVVLGEGAAVAASSGVHASAADKQRITVRVDGTSTSTSVSANGTFELQVSGGTFTLVFESGGVELGRVVVTAEPGGTVKIVVQVQGASVVVVEVKVENENEDDGDHDGDDDAATGCMIEGGKVGRGIELEGNVESGTSTDFKMSLDGERASGLVDVNAASASFRCNGDKKNTDCKSSVKPRAKVHVRGTLMGCGASSANVTATEVKVQKEAAEGDDD